MFEPGRIGRLLLPNRIVRSATNEGLADPEGRVGERYAAFMGRLASGRMGLIVTGHLFVREDGRASVGQGGIQDDAAIPGLRRAVRRVHDEGTPIVAQISHGGGQAAKGGTGHVAPSAVSDPAYGRVPAELSGDGIREIVGSFAAAAARAREAGFDGVEIHVAHGYLLSQFLSPHRNARTDAYGGSLAGRARIVLEVCEAIRGTAGPSYPLLVKLNGEDCVDGGLEPQEARIVSGMLAAAGVDAIEVSGGLPSSSVPSIVRKGIDTVGEEGYFLPLAKAVRAVAGIPVISVGGFRSPEVVHRALRSGAADFVSMARPFIREPGLVERWSRGDLRRATCISCNQCHRASRSAEGVRCVVEDGG